MDESQFFKIAKAGFPPHIYKLLGITKKNCFMFHLSGVYRLCNKDVEFRFLLPKEEHLSIAYYPEDSFVQISSGIKKFNHYAAVKKMEELNLLK